MSAPQITQEHRTHRVHANSLANLRKWEPGKSANPGGIAKGTVLIGERMKVLASLPPAEFEAYKPQTIADEIAKTRIQGARSERTQGLMEAKELLDRTEGKAPQRIEHSGTVNVDITVILTATREALNR